MAKTVDQWLCLALSAVVLFFLALCLLREFLFYQKNGWNFKENPDFSRLYLGMEGGEDHSGDENYRMNLLQRLVFPYAIAAAVGFLPLYYFLGGVISIDS